METRVREHRRCTGPDALGSTEALRAKAGGGALRLVIIDDNSDDRQLLCRELVREFPQATVVEVRSQEDLEKVLQSSAALDLVITDYQLFWTNGIDVINRLHDRSPEVPVIMFTGTGNEEVAVEAMKQGVYDYVLKSPRNLHRLIESVRAALHLHQQQRAQAAAETRFATLFNTVPVGLFRATPQGELLDVNPAFSTILGCDREELIGRSFSELHPEPSDFLAWREQLEREGAVARVESRFQDTHGHIRWVEIHAKALRDPDSGEVIYEGSVEDVTRDKAAEAERDQLIQRLQAALSKVRTLTGLLPICSSCKKIRDDRGRWNMLESFIENHSHAHFTHSFCPECARRLYPEVFLDTPKI